MILQERYGFIWTCVSWIHINLFSSAPLPNVILIFMCEHSQLSARKDEALPYSDLTIRRPPWQFLKRRYFDKTWSLDTRPDVNSNPSDIPPRHYFDMLFWRIVPTFMPFSQIIYGLQIFHYVRIARRIINPRLCSADLFFTF